MNGVQPRRRWQHVLSVLLVFVVCSIQAFAPRFSSESSRKLGKIVLPNFPVASSTTAPEYATSASASTVERFANPVVLPRIAQPLKNNEDDILSALQSQLQSSGLLVSVEGFVRQLPMVLSGLAFSATVIYGLAMSPEATSIPPTLISFESLEVAAENVVDAALPVNTADVVSIAVSEALGGVTGSFASFGISRALVMASAVATMQQGKNTKNKMELSSSSSSAPAELLGNSDYFLAKAGFLPLVSALGLPSTVTAVVSAALALVPYELVMLGSRRRKLRQAEDAMFDQLLREQQEKEAREMNKMFGPWLFPAAPATQVKVEDLKPVQEENDSLAVELFGDLVKWLSYAVLDAELGGRLEFNGALLNTLPGAEGALFGVLAGVGSLVYCDLLYALFGWGGEERQKQVTSRTLPEWLGLSLSRALATGTLFGVYETSQIPIQAFLSTLLSGGIENCVGSDNFNLCVDTFLQGNPPTATSPGEEVIALLQSLVGFWGHFDLPFL